MTTRAKRLRLLIEHTGREKEDLFEKAVSRGYDAAMEHAKQVVARMIYVHEQKPWNMAMLVAKQMLEAPTPANQPDHFPYEPANDTTFFVAYEGVLADRYTTAEFLEHFVYLTLEEGRKVIEVRNAQGVLVGWNLQWPDDHGKG